VKLLIADMEDLVVQDSLEILVEDLRRKVKAEKDDSVLESGKAALERAVMALEKTRPKKKLSLNATEVLELYGDGGWGLVWKVGCHLDLGTVIPLIYLCCLIPLDSLNVYYSVE
jgi:hypothetical protein